MITIKLMISTLLLTLGSQTTTLAESSKALDQDSWETRTRLNQSPNRKYRTSKYWIPQKWSGTTIWGPNAEDSKFLRGSEIKQPCD